MCLCVSARGASGFPSIMTARVEVGVCGRGHDIVPIEIDERRYSHEGVGAMG